MHVQRVKVQTANRDDVLFEMGHMLARDLVWEAYREGRRYWRTAEWQRRMAIVDRRGDPRPEPGTFGAWEPTKGGEGLLRDLFLYEVYLTADNDHISESQRAMAGQVLGALTHLWDLPAYDIADLALDDARRAFLKGAIVGAEEQGRVLTWASTEEPVLDYLKTKELTYTYLTAQGRGETPRV